MEKDNPIESYLEGLPSERKEILRQIILMINKRLPEGFEHCMSYGMPGWVVPHTLYPSGYHVNPKLPLPFISVASQKSHIALYHMGLYSDETLLEWFVQEYPKHSPLKLNMGKSCVRFKKAKHVPLELIGELVEKMGPQDWIKQYRSTHLSK
jgi:uncharacterized protein YdhG (YjbR/CyaY superfamily)